MSALTSTAPPAARRSRRTRAWGWLALAVAVVVLALVGAALAGGDANRRDALDPESVGPGGTRAVARILAQQGVEVRVVRDRAEARAALAAGAATLAMADATGLTDAAVQELVADAAAVVLLEPRSRTLGLLLNGSAPAGAFADAELDPACLVPAAMAAGPVAAGEMYEPGDGVSACYPGEEGYGMLVAASGDRTVTAIDGRTLLANDGLASAGNAALALAVLGAEPTLVWYVPSAGDADAAPPTLGDLTPGWVTPAILLLLAAGVAAGVWRGRRFGPLVAETLPVTVRASETTVGRGRLYARSGDAGHAAAQLRDAATLRLGRALGLGPRARAEVVADAVARRTGIDPRAVRSLLLSESPGTDRELVDFDRRLRELETAVHSALRLPEETS